MSILCYVLATLNCILKNAPGSFWIAPGSCQITVNQANFWNADCPWFPPAYFNAWSSVACIYGIRGWGARGPGSRNLFLLLSSFIHPSLPSPIRTHSTLVDEIIVGDRTILEAYLSFVLNYSLLFVRLHFRVSIKISTLCIGDFAV